MMRRFIGCLAALAMTLGVTVAAKAALVTQTFEATSLSGSQTATGSFTYDSQNPDIENERVLTPSDDYLGQPGLTVTFEFDGRSFTEENDANYDPGSPVTSVFPQLSFMMAFGPGGLSFEPFALDFLLEAGVNGVAFTNTDIISIAINRTYPLEATPQGSPTDFTTTMVVTLVPVPASLPLLISALAGFGFLGWRRKRPV